MSDNGYNDNDDDQNNSGGGLRAQLEDALKKFAAAEKRAAKAEQILAVNSVSASLKDKGYKESAAKWAAKDGVDVSDDKALDKWLEADGAEFKLPESEQTQEQQQDSAPDPDAVLMSGNLDRLRSNAAPADVNKYVTAIKGLPADASVAQVDAAMAGL